jgi:hypothetical protein
MNPNDRDLDDLLGERGGRTGDLYRRLPRYEPPRRLDRAVLGEAARAVRNGKPPRRQRWIVGVGSAAGIVLAAGIAWRIGHEPVATDIGADRSVVPVQPITESPRARQDEASQQEAPAAATANTATSHPSRMAGRAEADAFKRAQKPAPRAEAPRPATSQAPKPAAAAPAPVPPPAISARPQPFPESHDARAKTAEPETARSSADSANAPSTSKSSSRDEAASAGRLRRAAPSASPSSSIELQRDTRLSPDDWLSHIRELVRQDRRQQAIESLRLFVRAHPERHVPDDLQLLLE